MNLSLPTNATIADSQGVGTIINDDAQTPIVTTGAATQPTDSTALLNGTVNPNGLPTTGRFQYGPTTAYGNVSTLLSLGSGTGPIVFSIPIEGLACNTLYHFRAVGINSAGAVYGADGTFATAALCPLPPTVATDVPSNLTQTGATLHGIINPNGGVTNRRFEYGLTAAYGSTSPDFAIGSGNAPVNVSVQVTGLACNTLHHFRAVGQNGGGAASGADLTFTTAACPRVGKQHRGAHRSDHRA